MPGEYLSMEELRRLTGLSRTSLYLELQSGRLRSHRVGPANSRYKVTRKQVEDYLNACLSLTPQDRERLARAVDPTSRRSISPAQSRRAISSRT